ncbi:hypothetical protein, partial [Peribacillus glennii]|uniref:hypothetical protein n=1 Tax=Peribacillus glennii TaxID=2303991 RepID=UPI001F28B334
SKIKRKSMTARSTTGITRTTMIAVRNMIGTLARNMTMNPTKKTTMIGSKIKRKSMTAKSIIGMTRTITISRKTIGIIATKMTISTTT